MSVVVWDGRYLAADRRVQMGDFTSTTDKIHKLISSAVCGVVWDSNSHRHALLQRLNGADVAVEDMDKAEALVVKAPGEITLWQEGAPMLITSEYFAIGAGRDFALALLNAPRYLECVDGHVPVTPTAMMAVHFASQFVSSCGGGVTYWDSHDGGIRDWNADVR